MEHIRKRFSTQNFEIDQLPEAIVSAREKGLTKAVMNVCDTGLYSMLDPLQPVDKFRSM